MNFLLFGLFLALEGLFSWVSATDEIRSVALLPTSGRDDSGDEDKDHIVESRVSSSPVRSDLLYPSSSVQEVPPRRERLWVPPRKGRSKEEMSFFLCPHGHMV